MGGSSNKIAHLKWVISFKLFSHLIVDTNAAQWTVHWSRSLDVLNQTWKSSLIILSTSRRQHCEKLVILSKTNYAVKDNHFCLKTFQGKAADWKSCVPQSTLNRSDYCKLQEYSSFCIFAANRVHERTVFVSDWSSF